MKHRRMLTRRTVIRELRLSGEILDRLEELGLIVPILRAGKERAYGWEDVDNLRVYHTLVRELGVNDAGAEIILQMRDRLVAAQRRMLAVLGQMEEPRLLDELKRLLAMFE